MGTGSESLGNLGMGEQWEWGKMGMKWEREKWEYGENVNGPGTTETVGTSGMGESGSNGNGEWGSWNGGTTGIKQEWEWEPWESRSGGTTGMGEFGNSGNAEMGNGVWEWGKSKNKTGKMGVGNSRNGGKTGMGNRNPGIWEWGMGIQEWESWECRNGE